MVSTAAMLSNPYPRSSVGKFLPAANSTPSKVADGIRIFDTIQPVRYYASRILRRQFVLTVELVLDIFREGIDLRLGRRSIPWAAFSRAHFSQHFFPSLAMFHHRRSCQQRLEIQLPDIIRLLWQRVQVAATALASLAQRRRIQSRLPSRCSAATCTFAITTG